MLSCKLCGVEMPSNKIASIALVGLLILSAGTAATGFATAAPANQTADADQEASSTALGTSEMGLESLGGLSIFDPIREFFSDDNASETVDDLNESDSNDNSDSEDTVSDDSSDENEGDGSSDEDDAGNPDSDSGSDDQSDGDTDDNDTDDDTED